MNSLCRNCTKFGKCGFGGTVEMYILRCPKYERGKINHQQNVYRIAETKRGRPAKEDSVSTKKEIGTNGIEKRIRKILKEFPHEFHAKDLKTAYEKKYGQPLVFTSTLRKAVCKPWKYGILVNKCRVRKSKTSQTL
jgi:hypothetical protein